MLEDRQEGDQVVGNRIRNFMRFYIKDMVFGLEFTHFLKHTIKGDISFILCDGLPNVLLVNLKALLVVSRAVAVNRKQWLFPSPEISTMKTSSLTRNYCTP